MKREEFNKRELLKYVGNTSQLFGVKDYCLNGGKAKGVRAVDIKNGAGLEFTVLPDRALDIACLSYKSTNFSYLSSTGIVAPQYFDEMNGGFLKNFFGGFLTTCGLTNVGSACSDNGEAEGLHGRIANIPAEEVYAGTEWIGENPVMTVKGKMRDARFFGQNISLHREISVGYRSNKIFLKDTVENNGFRDEPFMILYHFNIGYPLLTEDSYLITPSISITPRDDEAKTGLKEYDVFQKPTAGYKEQVFYHDLSADEAENTFAAIINPVIKTGVVIRFKKSQLCKFTQWKQMGQGEYVLGIEPCNCRVEGREKARQEGTLEIIKAGEKRDFSLELEIVDSEEAIEALRIQAGIKT